MQRQLDLLEAQLDLMRGQIVMMRALLPQVATETRREVPASCEGKAGCGKADPDERQPCPSFGMPHRWQCRGCGVRFDQ